MTEKSKATNPLPESWLDTWKWTTTGAPLIEANRPLDDWMRYNEALWNHALTFSREVAEFAQERLREDIEICGKLARCQGPGEATECQREFARTATAQYLDCANRLAALMTNVASYGFNLAQRAVPEGSQAAPHKTK